MMQYDSTIAAWRAIPTPMGDFLLALATDGTCRTDWPDRLGHDWPDVSLHDDTCCPNEAEILQRYFNGEAVDPAGCTGRPLPQGPPFHRACWRACRLIPMGRTISYPELAREAGSPLAIRAAGGGMRKNPAPILVPCHRVVSSSGGLGGFAGHGDPDSDAVHLKRELLAFESIHSSISTEAALNRASDKELMPCT